MKSKKQQSHEAYFDHLQKISFLGKAYKRLYSKLILLICNRKYGSKVLEIGSGIGNGVLGASPSQVIGLDINPEAVEFCKAKGLDADLINDDGVFPVENASVDVCVLDNVLEHIENPQKTLDECHRATKKFGGLVIIVPGMKGYKSDDDHKVFYDSENLKTLDPRWKMNFSFTVPFIFESKFLSESLSQYCLVAVYTKSS